MAAMALCRFAHAMALMLAFGGCLFLRAFAGESIRPDLSRTSRPLIRIAAIVAGATGALWFALETASVTGEGAAAWDPGAIFSVVTETSFGRAWAVHLMLVAAFLIAALSRRAGWTALTVGSALALASLALVGHAAMQGVEGLAHRGNDALHLICAGAWVGGLPPFALCLNASRQPGLRRAATTAMIRFSFAGHFAVAAVVATGIANIAMTGGLPWPPSTAYRQLLDIKILAVATMIALALVNRYGLVPRLVARPAAFATLRALSLANVALGAAAVAMVSVFGMLDPT